MALDRETRVGMSIHKIGSSYGPIIPKDWRDQFDLDPDEDVVDVVANFEDRTITFHI
jgi:antitoxin component of MazEF toxin-antitoxin module